ncbi:MAG TPA: GNAT family N-acetyltransferase [Acidimicrobiales bacterium]|nr:GNAT family N-acetyltransferase [Acidimicrobiales bacterium]
MLRPFTDVDRAPFAALNTHPLVVESLGSSPTRAESDVMIDRYSTEMAREGWGFWAVSETGGAPFIGMVGLHRVQERMPFAPAIEVGWRLHPDHWGHGYATEAAAASLAYGFGDGAMHEIVAFTTVVNTRSQAVMARIGMSRDREGDFDHPAVAVGSRLRRHVLYRISAPATPAAPPSQATPSVAP